MMQFVSPWWAAAPSLPALWVQQMGMGALWGLVLAWWVLAVALRLRPSMGVRARSMLVLAVIALSCWPSAASPTYWLGLSFQSPSLVLGAIAAYGVWVQLSTATAVAAAPGPWAARGAHVTWLCALGVALGWVLMLDTLALWQQSVYALGFSSVALLAVALVLVALPVWLKSMQAMPLALLCGVLLVFALTRLPSGNVWDALSDPLLWVGLHFKLMRDVLGKQAV